MICYAMLQLPSLLSHAMQKLLLSCQKALYVSLAWSVSSPEGLLDNLFSFFNALHTIDVFLGQSIVDAIAIEEIMPFFVCFAFFAMTAIMKLSIIVNIFPFLQTTIGHFDRGKGMM